jgi:hypothetical protein
MDATVMAGAARADITPPLGTSMGGYWYERRAEGVHDRLYAKAVVLDDGLTRLAIVACDLVGCQKETLSKALEIIKTRSGIAHDSVMISCTHIHTGPNTVSRLGLQADKTYMEWLPTRIADSVQLAVNALRPACPGVGVGRQGGVSFNRRYRLQDGTVGTYKPEEPVEVVEPMGPIDPDVGVLYLEEPDGSPIAMLVNFALHPDTVGGCALSADYPAFLSDTLHKLLSEDMVVLFANGACGDINHLDPKRRGKFRGWHITRRTGQLLGAEAFKATRRLSYPSTCSLVGKKEKVHLSTRKPTGEQIEAAEEVIRRSEGQWTREVSRAASLLNLLEMDETVEIEVQALAIGDLALVGLPGEMFVELGLAIKKGSPYEYTFVVELANDYVGYVPTAKAFTEGGYELLPGWASRLAPEAGEVLVNTTLRLLKRL